MKNALVTLAVIVSCSLLSFTEMTYANLDGEVASNVKYDCVDEKEGVLTHTISLQGKPLITHVYRGINAAGILYTPDAIQNTGRRAQYRSISSYSNFTIPGCGCPPKQSSNQVYSATDRYKSGDPSQKLKENEPYTLKEGGVEGVIEDIFWDMYIQEGLTVYTDQNGGVPYHCEEETRCGDGILEPQYEECDPGDTKNQFGWGVDGCSETCKRKGPLKNEEPQNPQNPQTPSETVTNPDGGVIGDTSTQPSGGTDGGDLRGVRVLGNIIGQQISEEDQNKKNVILDQSTFSTIRNTIMRNVSALTRSMEPRKLTQGIIYFENNTRYSDILEYGDFQTAIIYGDLTIDGDMSRLKGLIVLKDKNGNGGNVIVGDDVRSIHAMIFAEGSLRGMSTEMSVSNPKTQLIIRGALYSQNTIGGSIDPDNLYIYPNERTTDSDKAFIQDLNNVRSGNDASTRYLDMYNEPLIIHYDSAVVSNPMPGF